jgi:hypothetical protein
MSEWIKKENVGKIILQKTFVAPTPEALDLVCNEFKKEHRVIASVPDHIDGIQQVAWVCTLFYEAKE